MNNVEPPLGVMPEWLWKEKRAEDLARAIYNYVVAREAGREVVLTWCLELEGLLNYLQKRTVK